MTTAPPGFTARRMRSNDQFYRFVSVSGPPGNGAAQLLELTAIDPESVDATAMAALIVPPSCPVHEGCVGTPPGLTEIV